MSLRNLQNQLVGLVNICCSKGDFDFRFALVDYRDHRPKTSIVARVQSFTSDVNKMKSYVKKLKQRQIGDRKGLADGLALVLSLADYENDGKCREDAAKMCIVLRKYVNVYFYQN